MPPEITWQHWLERLYNLRRDKHGMHERPHKPALLLAVLSLVDRGDVANNRVALSSDLVTLFKRIFSVVRSRDDQPKIENPFYHLCGDGFWHLTPVIPGDVIYRKGEASGTPGIGELRRRVAYASFEPALWSGLIADPLPRHQLREALVSRYFPEHRAQLAALHGELSAKYPAATAPAPILAEEVPGRDAAFRNTILKLYDYICAACGMRIKLNDGFSLVDAAHIIPWSLSRNDKPNNGLALCPNHHRAMDQFLIAPCPDATHLAGVWRVSKRLDDRHGTRKELVSLSGRPVLEPGESMFLPAPESLSRRDLRPPTSVALISIQVSGFYPQPLGYAPPSPQPAARRFLLHNRQVLLQSTKPPRSWPRGHFFT